MCWLYDRNGRMVDFYYAGDSRKISGYDWLEIIYGVKKYSAIYVNVVIDNQKVSYIDSIDCSIDAEFELLGCSNLRIIISDNERHHVHFKKCNSLIHHISGCASKSKSLII